MKVTFKLGSYSSFGTVLIMHRVHSNITKHRCFLFQLFVQQSFCFKLYYSYVYLTAAHVKQASSMQVMQYNVIRSVSELVFSCGQN